MAQITNKLLKQAIADAEAVRETAVANAKLVLEESITPQIRDMISRRLKVEAESHDEDEDEDTDTETTSSADTEDGAVADEVDESAPEVPHEDAEHEDGVGPEDTSKIGGADNTKPSPESSKSSDIDSGGEAPSDSSDDWYDDWSEDDFELESVIKELEDDIAALSKSDEDDDEDSYPASSPEGNEKKKVPAASSAIGKTPDPDSVDETESAMDGLKYASATLKNDEKDAKSDDDADDAPDSNVGSAGGDDDDDEELSIDEILAELEADDEDEVHGAAPNLSQLAADVARLKDELSQYKDAVNILRDRLHEVNLLNAKLLFTNKMFKKDGLTNEQKVRIVESFDRATTVREVKLVYTALVENLSTAARTFVASRKKIVSEGLASRPVASTAPRSEPSDSTDNSAKHRLQVLAGII